MTSSITNRAALAAAVLLTASAAAWAQGTGNGLLVEHYNNNSLTAPVAVTKVDVGPIDFTWAGTATPDAAALTLDVFSSRYRGRIEGPVTGNVIFELDKDDTGRLWINGGNNGTANINAGGGTSTAAAIPMVAGQLYDIVIEHLETGGDARIRLRWSHAGTGDVQQVVLKTFLYSPAAVPADPTLSASPGGAAPLATPQLVTLSCATANAEIWYTVDGSDPGFTSHFYNAAARLYTGPFTMDTYATIRARSYLGGVASGLLTSGLFSPSFPALGAPPAFTGGIYYRHYFNAAAVATMPNYEAMIPERSASALLPNAGTAGTVSRLRGENYGYRYTGYVNIPGTGTWNFTLPGLDDGGRIYIDSNLVASAAAGGSIVLQAGWHPITVDYYENGGGNTLTVQWQGPTIPAATTIPNTSLGRDAMTPAPTCPTLTGSSFTGTLPLTITSAGATIYYTLDGNAPDLRYFQGSGASPLLINLTSSARVRAVAIAPNMLPCNDYLDISVIKTDAAPKVASAIAAGLDTQVEVNFHSSVADPSTTAPAPTFSLGAGPAVTGAVLRPRNADLRGWWKLEDTGIADASGNGNTGTAVNGAAADATAPLPPLFPSNLGGLNFDGTDDHVNIPDAASLALGSTGGFTVSLWVRPFDGTNRRLLSKWDGPGDRGWFANINDPDLGYLRFRVDDGTTSSENALYTGITLNEWQLLTLRFDRLKCQLSVYRNGILMWTHNAATNLTAFDFARPLLLGRLENPNTTANGNHYRGQMDDVRLYAVPLSEAEITGLYHGAVDPSTRLMLTTGTAMSNNTAYTVTVNGVQGPGGGAIAGGTADFTYRSGGIAYQRYTNFTSGAAVDVVRNAAYPYRANLTKINASAEEPQTNANIDNYAMVMRGYFIPPTTGDWVFSLACDDHGELWLSTDDDPVRKRRISYVTSWTNYKDHTNATTGTGVPPTGNINSVVQSGPNDAALVPADTNNLGLTISLIQGQRYYLEAFAREGGGNDHIAIAAKINNGTPIANQANSITGTDIAPYVESASYSRTLRDVTAMTGQTLTFTASFIGDGLTFQWKQGGVNVGTNSPTLTLTNVNPANSGNYSVDVTSFQGAAVSLPQFALTVVNPPTPTISAILPTTGPVLGGQMVRVTGTNLSGLASLQLGGTTASNPFWTAGGTTLYAVSPAHAAGLVSAVVSVPGSTGTLAGAYTYYDRPTFAALNPIVNPVGDSGAPTSVTINGTNFTPGTTVSFGLLSATSIVVNPNGQSLTCLAPAQAGQVDVTLTTSFGQAVLTNGFRYYDDPTLAAVNPIVPPNGPNEGGPVNGVTITGTNFAPGFTWVQFNGGALIPATVTPAGDSLTVTPPTGTPGTTVPVTVIAPGGSVTQLAAYTYYNDPTIGTITSGGPDDGGPVNGVTITGNNFLDGFTTVQFNGGALIPAVVNPLGTSLTVTPPAGTAGTSVSVTVNAPGGSVTQLAAYSYFADPMVTAVLNTNTTAFLNNGAAIGGNSVQITGTFLLGATSVKFGGVDALTFTVVNATTITATTPAGSGTVVVEVVTPGGTAATGSWTYHAAPLISGVSPNPGTTQGNVQVQISGSNFPTGLTAFTFDGIPATGVDASVNPALATTPAHAAGDVNVVVSTPGGQNTLTNGYTYAGPFISTVVPNVGPAVGGKTVNINGSGLSGATSVTIGGAPATITGNTAGQITVTSPAGTAGPAVAVFVQTPSGTFTLAGAYTYTGTPTITTVTPNKGPTGGGQSITIDGTNFALPADTAVTINGVACTGVAVTGTTLITCLTPPHAAGGPFNVVVTTYTNQPSITPATYTYFAPPTLGTMAPNRGPMAGGQVVSITGTNFVDGFTEVLFNGVPVTPSGVTSSGLSVTTPSNASATTVNVAVRTFNPSGVTTSSLPYTYVNQATAVDLSLTKTVNNGSAGVGQDVIFTITLSNTGQVAGSGVVVTDLLPAALTYKSHGAGVGTYVPATGVWTVGNIAVSGTAVLTITATVNSSVSVTNVAEVTAATQEDVNSVPNNGSLTEDDRATASVDAGLAIQTPNALPAGTAGAYYSVTLAASGGNAPYTWSLAAAPPASPAFPFNLDPATGVISGFAPDVVANYSFTIQVADAGATPQTSSKAFTLAINIPTAGPPVVNAPAPNGVVGQAYRHLFTAAGGATPYTWTSTGTVPAGLALNRFTGVLEGVPTTAGAASFFVIATPAGGAASAPFQVTFTIGANATAISPATLPGGTVGAGYEQYVEVTGGVGPFTWNVSAGSTGLLTLTPLTGRRVCLIGTPTANLTFTLRVVDAGQSSLAATQAYTITVAAAGGALVITQPAIGFPVGTVGRPYVNPLAAPPALAAVTLSATGSTPPYFWQVAPGSAAPPGLSVNANGDITGTPTTAGIFSFTVWARLFDGGITPPTAADITIVIAPPPTLTTPLTLPSAVEGSGYFAQLTFAGGADPVTWSGTLPTGLDLNAQTGTITGIPSVNGTLVFSLTATDVNGASVSGNFTLTIAPTPGALAVVSATLPRGTVNVPYSGTLFAAGGLPPYDGWIIQSGGPLPAGLTLDPDTGTISGTPTVASSTVLTFRVNDSTPATSPTSAAITLVIDANLAITTATLPAAGVSSPYDTTISTSGGVNPLVWDLVSGSLPGGVTLSPTGNLGGTVSATAVTTSFQVRVTDSLGRTATRGYTITVGPAIPQGGGGSSGGGGCGGSIGLSTLPLGALASLAGLLALATRRRRKV